MNTIREIERINEEELNRGIAGTPSSWHAKYAHSSWVYAGNLDHSLTEGDVVAVLSQYGEIEDLHLIRDEETGKSKGFAFCKYEDSRSCVLAVDNFSGTKLCGRPMRVDHVENYRLPKQIQEKEEEKDGQQQKYTGPGHAYIGKELSNQYSLEQGQDLFAPVTTPQKKDDERYSILESPTKEENDTSDNDSDSRSSSNNRSADKKSRDKESSRKRYKKRKKESRYKEDRKKKRDKKGKKEKKERKRRKRDV